MSGARATLGLIAEFERAGFEVVWDRQLPNRLGVRKNRCLRSLRLDAKENWHFAGPPSFDVDGVHCKLEDGGYQKFWYGEGKRVPVRKSDLETLHRFDQEVRAILGIRSLYHEALGTTSTRSAYDRLAGRSAKR